MASILHSFKNFVLYNRKNVIQIGQLLSKYGQTRNNPYMKYTDTARQGYANLFASLSIKPEKLSAVDAICDKILYKANRYSYVSAKTGVPWYVIAILHHMESGGSFSTHLHNGDSLSKRTINEPKGRPATGAPPFAWNDSAIDALTGQPHALHKVNDWTIERTLYEMEKYNGWGYVGKKINSPYLWSFSNLYTQGKYATDGNYVPNLVSEQCGAAVILKRLIEKGHIMTAMLPLLPLIERVAPILALKLIGPEAAAAVKVLGEMLGVDGANSSQVAAAVEGSPTSVATQALLAAEKTLAANEPAVPASPPPASPNGVLVDPEASVVKSLVGGLLFVGMMWLFRDAATAQSWADALTPIIGALFSGGGGAAVNWLLHRSVKNSNKNTIMALSST